MANSQQKVIQFSTQPDPETNVDTQTVPASDYGQPVPPPYPASGLPYPQNISEGQPYPAAGQQYPPGQPYPPAGQQYPPGQPYHAISPPYQPHGTTTLQHSVPPGSVPLPQATTSKVILQVRPYPDFHWGQVFTPRGCYGRGHFHPKANAIKMVIIGAVVTVAGTAALVLHSFGWNKSITIYIAAGISVAVGLVVLTGGLNYLHYLHRRDKRSRQENITNISSARETMRQLYNGPV